MTHARKRLGRAAEEQAAAELTRRGWHLVEQNARLQEGEIDLIATCGGCLAFVEVKARREGADQGPERAALAVDAAKQRRLRRLAAAWLAARRPPPHRELRFDVVGVSFDRDGLVAGLEHIPNAF